MITKQDGQQSDEQLMLAYQAGQQKAFDALYQRYRQPIFAYLMRNIGLQVQAEEVYQEVWLSLIKQRSRYTASASFRSYLFCIAHSRLLDFYRQQGKLAVNDVLDENDVNLVACAIQQPDQQLEQQRLMAKLQGCISQIPEEQRAVLVLKLESELSLQTIAEQLNIAFETLKSRFRYAQAKLQRCLGEES